MKANKPDAGGESCYSALELAAAAAGLGTRPEAVTAALKSAGRTNAGKSEAADIVREFLERKVQ